MWRVITLLLARLTMPVPEAIRDEFHVLLAQRMIVHSRYLYVGLLITVLPAMYSSSDKAPWWATTLLPLIIGALMIIGFIALIPLNASRISVREARKYVFDANWATPLIASLCSLWCVVNWSYAPAGLRAYYPLILSMGSLATVYCISLIRVAAILNILIGLLPISLLMLLNGERLDRVAATCLLVAAAFLLRLIFDQHQQFVSLLSMQHEMRLQANTDPLTGLLNRRALTLRINAHINDPAQRPFLLALLDLDGFKPVNDVHGHAAGDMLLIEVGRRLTIAAGSGACVARMGGDEFAVLLPPQEQPSPDIVSATLLASLIAPFAIDGATIRVGASIGMAQWPNDGADMDALFETADSALYAVKHQHRDAVRVDHRNSLVA
jgi:diguanylate cyclase